MLCWPVLEMSVLPETVWWTKTLKYLQRSIWLMKTPVTPVLVVGSKQNRINPCLLTMCCPSDTHLCVTLEPVPLEVRKTACPSSIWDRTWWILLHFWVLLIVNHEVPDQTSAFGPCKLYWTAAACWICPPFSLGGKQMLSLEILERSCVSSR